MLYLEGLQEFLLDLSAGLGNNNSFHIHFIGRRADMFLLIRNLRYIKTLQSSEVFLLINLNRTTPILAKHKLMWQSLLNPTRVIIINTIDVF
jgi:hypothetical protein